MLACSGLLSTKLRSYVSTVHRIVHDVNPALENGHLEESQVGVAHVVKVDVGVLPGETLG